MRRRVIYCAVAAIVALMLGACSTGYTRMSQYPKMYDEHPVTLLIMPPINNTTNVDAKDLLYTSVSKPLVEAGYYVISPLLALDVLKNESAYDAEMFFDGSVKKFGEFFGADAVVFSVIETWAKQGLGITTKLHYIIKSTHTDEIIFDRTCDLYLDLGPKRNNSNSSLVADLVDVAVSAINTALTDHIVAARKANAYVFSDIPRGKYHPDYGKDSETDAQQRNIKVTVK